MSYRRDLAQFAGWLAQSRGRSLIGARAEDLQRHLAWQVETRHAKPRTTGRLVSSLKRFYQFAVREGLRADDPAAELEGPKLPRSLPKSLSEAQVEALLAAPDVATAAGLRDRAMLETLYASGLRVSELVGLKAVQVSLDMGVVRVLGKGSKERLTPLGEEAVEWIGRYLGSARPQILSGRKSDALFVTARAAPMTRQAFLGAREAPCQARGHRARHLAAHAAPRVRHAPHQPRGGPARGPAPARARGHLDHADLHPRRARAAEGAARAAPPARMIDPAQLSPWLLLVAPLTVVLAYTVFGLSGFGSTAMSVPILAHFLPVSYLVPLMALLDCASSSFVGTTERQHVAKGELKWLIPLMFGGFVIGATVLVRVPDHYLRIALGIFAMAIGVHSVANPSVHRKISRLWVVPVGLVGGAVATVFGAGGPIYATYLAARLGDKSQVRATTSALISDLRVQPRGDLRGSPACCSTRRSAWASWCWRRSSGSGSSSARASTWASRSSRCAAWWAGCSSSRA